MVILLLQNIKRYHFRQEVVVSQCMYQFTCASGNCVKLYSLHFPHTVFAYWELFYSSDLVYTFPPTSESSAVVEMFSVLVMDRSGKLWRKCETLEQVAGTLSVYETDMKLNKHLTYWQWERKKYCYKMQGKHSLFDCLVSSRASINWSIIVQRV